MDSKLSGWVVLVVGGSSGIGLATARLLLSEGAHVVIASPAPETEEVLALQAVSGAMVSTVAMDVALETSIVSAFAQVLAKVGHLNGVVILPATTAHQLVTDLTYEALERVWQTNLAGPLLVCREAARHFMQQKSGSIVLVGSTATTSAQPSEAGYRSSKAGLQSIVGTLAVELVKYGVRVNMVIPGGVNTSFVAGTPTEIRAKRAAQIPIGREAEPFEIAPAVVHLLSDALSPYTTGASLIVDGGLSLRPLD